MLRRSLASAPFIASLLIATYGIAHAGEPRAFLELFTSQGCSSCPPADKLLGELSADPSLVTLSVPIDYWDYLGWKDTLASSVHSARQRAYAHQRGDRQVYTPQIVPSYWQYARARQRPCRHRARHHADGSQRRDHASVPVLISVGGEQFEREARFCGQDARRRRSLALSAREISSGGNRPRRKPRTHGHLPHCGAALAETRRLDLGRIRPGSVLLASIASDDIDGAVVMVQEGTHDKPGKHHPRRHFLAPIGAQATGDR